MARCYDPRAWPVGPVASGGHDMQGQRDTGSARSIAIIGAGPGGMCMGMKLKQAGFDNFVILEKGSRVGGTWYHNRYPGAACDIMSHLYSYSFELKTDWSRP